MISKKMINDKKNDTHLLSKVYMLKLIHIPRLNSFRFFAIGRVVIISIFHHRSDKVYDLLVDHIEARSTTIPSIRDIFTWKSCCSFGGVRAQEKYF